MQLLSTLAFVGLASASVPRAAENSLAFLLSERAMRGVVERQYQSCEKAYGPGFINCIDEAHCWNPSKDVCCSNTWVCPKGTRCIPGHKCCPNGMSLEECGATETLSAVPPPAATKGPSNSTGRPQAPTATASTPLRPVVTAGAEKNAQVGILAAVGGLGALLMAV